MLYNRNFWKPGDIITSEKWNKIINASDKQINLTKKLIIEKLSTRESAASVLSIINISPLELKELFDQGTICYFIINQSDNLFTIWYLFQFAIDSETKNNYQFVFFCGNANNETVTFTGEKTATQISTSSSIGKK